MDVYKAIDRAIKLNEKDGVVGTGLYFFNLEHYDTIGGEVISVDNDGVDKWIPADGDTLIFLGEDAGENIFWVYYALINGDDTKFIRISQPIGRDDCIESIPVDDVPINFLLKFTKEEVQ